MPEVIPNGNSNIDVTLITDEIKKEAEDIKNDANSFFKDGKYDKALDLYTNAIELNPFVAAYYGNRSFCNIKLECFGSALQDANQAIKLDKKYVKLHKERYDSPEQALVAISAKLPTVGYYRRASANMALGKFKLSLKDYEAVFKVCPNDKDARMKFTECRKIVHQQAFAKAIAVDDAKSIIETLNLDSMIVPPDYSGPTLVDGKITKKFMDELLPYLKDQKKLHKKYAFQILVEIKNYFETLPSLVEINFEENEHLTVCGDIHGQFYDLLNIFELNGLPSEENPYLFNGDFVDRGSFSVEVIFTLFGFKLLYPNHFFMARGNHESSNMNQMYGFEGEVKEKYHFKAFVLVNSIAYHSGYSSKMADLFTEVYNLLPLSHLINKKVLTMHGGLFSEDNVTLEDIKNTSRNRQPPDSGIMCDLLWSDPQPQCGRAPSKRGVGVSFGPDVTKRFLEKNNLEYIIRSHEVKPEGYEVNHDGKCITVFSAPNYCDQMGNKGAFITLKSDLVPKYTTYAAVVDIALAFDSLVASLLLTNNGQRALAYEVMTHIVITDVDYKQHLHSHDIPTIASDISYENSYFDI